MVELYSVYMWGTYHRREMDSEWINMKQDFCLSAHVVRMDREEGGVARGKGEVPWIALRQVLCKRTKQSQIRTSGEYLHIRLSSITNYDVIGVDGRH